MKISILFCVTSFGSSCSQSNYYSLKQIEFWRDSLICGDYLKEITLIEEVKTGRSIFIRRIVVIMFSKYCCFYYQFYIYYFSLSEIEEAFHFRNGSVVFNVLKNLWDLSRLSFDESYKSSAIAQRMKFSIKDFFSTCDQIHRYLRIRLHLLKKSSMETFIFCAVCTPAEIVYLS